MKLVIEDYIEKDNLIILALSSIFSKNILFENLHYENNTITIDFNYNNTILKIFSKNNKQDKKFYFYKGDKLICKYIGSECVIKIYNYQIETFNIDNFNKLRTPLITGHNKSIIYLWNNYWYYLHWLCYNYPKCPSDQDKKEIENLVNVMRTTGIKCSKCKNHFDKWLEEKDINPYLETQEKLFNYFFILHNDVNKRNEKKIFTLEEAISLFRDKDWTLHFKKFNVDILQLFKERKLDTFPDEFYNKVQKNLRLEIGITQTLENLVLLEKEPFKKKEIINLKEINLKESKNQIKVKKGWNLIGSIKSGKLNNINIEDNLIFEYSNQQYKLVTKILEGKGYWIRCLKNGIIEYE